MADDEMVAWLSATLDALEEVAGQASRGVPSGAAEWTRQCGHTGIDGQDLPPSHDLCCVVEGDNIRLYDEGGHDPDQANHIALHDPRAVLARVEAERALIAAESDDVLRILAWGHRFDAPGFRDGWSPK